MSKWRPSKNCLYVIPDIHGKYNQLKLILNRILPLRNTGGSQDKIVFLGDYIDRNTQSNKVLNLLIDLKKEYPDQTIFIKGNHEDLFQHAMTDSNSDNYMIWMDNGGEETLLGYLRSAGISDISNTYLFDRKRISSIVPQQHKDFIANLQYYYETDEYIFVHGGFDPSIPADKQNTHELLWGNGLYRFVKEYAFIKKELPWKKTIVMGHYWDGPFVYDKFMMLDRMKVGDLIITELNSRELFLAKPGNNRLVKSHLDNFQEDNITSLETDIINKIFKSIR